MSQQDLNNHWFQCPGDELFSTHSTICLIQEYEPLKSWSHHVLYGQALMQTSDDGHGPVSSVRKQRYRGTQPQLTVSSALLMPNLITSTSISLVHYHLQKDTHTYSHVWIATSDGQKQYSSHLSQQKRQLKLFCTDGSHGLDSP